MPVAKDHNSFQAGIVTHKFPAALSIIKPHLMTEEEDDDDDDHHHHNDHDDDQ